MKCVRWNKATIFWRMMFATLGTWQKTYSLKREMAINLEQQAEKCF
jgi:hypothetical protein